MPSKRLLGILVTTALALTLLANVQPVPVTHAATLTFMVTSTTDAHDATPGDGVCASTLPGGACTLRAAIEEANALPGGSSIDITLPAGLYGLTQGTLQLTANNITINGAMSRTTVINANNISTVMAASRSVQATLRQVMLTGGNAGLANGGGLINNGLTVLSNSAIIRNTAGDGGGIFNAIGARLAAVNSTLSGNVASNQGGGIDNTGTMILSSSTLSGNSAMGFGGGAIVNIEGTMILSATTASRNSAIDGGGIQNYAGTMTLTNSTASNNVAAGLGGGVYNHIGTLTLTNSTISNNVAASVGGGIYNDFFSTLILTGSTLDGNSALAGGGIDDGGTMVVSNTTLYRNLAPQGDGGGIYNSDTMTLSSSTLRGNVALAGGEIFNYGYASTTLEGTIVAATSGRACSGAIDDGGYNLDGDRSCGFRQATDITGENPLLGPLANNGGPTMTMALLPGSPAIDHGGTSANGCPATDQRGVTRPQGPACDIGAYEAQAHQ